MGEQSFFQARGAGGVPEFFGKACAEVARRGVAAGEVIHRECDPADSLYFIERGEVRLYQAGPDGGDRLVEILGPGDWFGIAALAGSCNCEKRAEAVTAASVALLPVDQFMSMLQASPMAASAFVRELAGKLHTARKDLGRFVFDDCRQRIIKTLIDFSKTAAASALDGDGGEVVLRITHEELAQAIGVARETVSLELTKLKKEELVKTGRSRLVFSPAMLQKHGQGNGCGREVMS